ncbi:MAG: zinc ribbon domain-containing protein, partial [Eubacteriaceae bacterium]|nr:zinc ribbon domain-containing protein [Eubacteriaceae bacterium]
HNWHKGLFGKQVQHSAMGSIKEKLKTNSKVHVVARSFPSTQICPVCGNKTKHPLMERQYTCDHCGYRHSSRDVKAALSILDEALRCTGHTAKSPVEITTSVDANCVDKPLSMKQEAQVL